MSKTMLIAWREFSATVLTKGFIIGILMTPLLILISVGGSILAMREGGPKLEGSVAIIDQTPGQVVAPRILKRFSPEELEKEERRERERFGQAAAEATKSVPTSTSQREMAGSMAAQAGAESVRKASGLKVEVLASTTKPEEATKPLADVDVHARATDPNAPLPRVMVIVIPPGSIAAKAGEPGSEDPPYEGFSAYTAPRLDFELSDRVQRRVGDAIVDARVESNPALASSGLTGESVRAMTRRPEAKVVSVTKAGEKQNVGEIQRLIPMAFLFLLFMSVMVSSQYLLTSTIEEKSSRVMEVVLSAVSPMQLMLGKILGQMGVGVLMIGLYSGAGVAGLLYLSLQDTVEPWKIACLLVYFLIAYFSIASLMAAAGSAVNDMREAQALVTPIMMLMIVPWMLSMAIGRAPNSTFAQALSFIPGCNAFVMVTRLFGSEPVPFWQVPVSMAIGLAGAVFFAWSAAKVFRIGVLMYGKAPNWTTLIKWIRMA